LHDALALYRKRFKPSRYLDKPRVMVAVNAFAADDKDAARTMFSSMAQAFARLRSGMPGPLPPPRKDFEATLSPVQRAMLQDVLAVTAVGTKDDVVALLRAVKEATSADEIIVASMIFDHDARLRSYEITADAFAAV
jgi:alkanesulfonate monooxygenase SsuD/methylene tetrahydromethanopterin reductase-like flavin-dependent oxidoreductase (luciferase family)